MDVSLTYHLARAHVGSLANEPEGVMHPHVAQLAAQDGGFQLAQSRAVSSAKESAVSALLLASAKNGFADRLVYLPTFYHFLLSHAAGFLLLLVQRKWRVLLAGESQRILDLVETFAKTYVFEISAYVPSTDPNAHGNASNGIGAVHPALATAESLQGALRHVLSQCRPGPA
ncbi:hypothetical protein CBOM_04826 [Ceraceosorus bombacis]|uniref:Uncharacterized protein n=1 Tax=Ceraceosorus bombacis TaxID=401625 RepID=A0A0P1BRI5_9BASI|nr:hypothetical protein CBOM_04826 [Ceraceosorus bombacis]